MRTTLCRQLQDGRITAGPYRTTNDDGPNGAFDVFYRGRRLHVIASDGRLGFSEDDPLGGWEHVSVSVREQPRLTPAWRDMCFIKDLFWGEDETVVQFHPRSSDYMNFHPGCLHLWKKVDADWVLPPAILVAPE